MKNIELIIPPIELQKKFEEIVKSMDSIIKIQRRSSYEIGRIYKYLTNNGLNQLAT